MASCLPDFNLGSSHPSTSMQDDPVFSRLYARIAVLETELRHAKEHADESSRGARYLLTLQASAQTTCDTPAVNELRKQMQQLRLENNSLRDQVDYNGSRTYNRDPLSSSQNSSDFDHQPETSTQNDSQDVTLIDMDVDLFQGMPTPSLQPTAQHTRKHSVITIQAPDNVTSQSKGNSEIKPVLDFKRAPMTAPDKSMLQGRLEWADESDMIQPVTRDRLPSKALNPLPIYQPGQKLQIGNDSNNEPRASQPLAKNTGLTGSQHCPSNHIETHARDPIDIFTSRPDHARDGNWIRWRPKGPRLQTSERVLITNLPDTITASTLLSQVCGGLIVSCQIVPTIPLTGSPSALIRFVDAESARSFTAYAALNPISFPDSCVKGVKTIKTARVSLIRTPSFPLTRHKIEGIKNHGHTRCLELRNFPVRVDTTRAMEDLMWFLRPYEKCGLDFVESIDWESDDSGSGALKISFTSVDAAVDAFGKFMGNELYRKCWAKFVRDPCERVAKVVVGKEEESELEDRVEVVRKEVEGIEKVDRVNPDEIEVDLEDDTENSTGDTTVNMELECTGKPANSGSVAVAPMSKNEHEDVAMTGDSASDDTAMNTPASEIEDIDINGSKERPEHEADLPLPRN